MGVKLIQTPEVDPDSTDKLPILEGVRFDPDFQDDAVRMELAPVAPPLEGGAAADFIRPSPVDLPSLAETVRIVEARIERQNAEYEALSRSYEGAREAEAAASARAHTLEKELAAALSALESEQARSRDVEKTLAEKAASIDAKAAQVLHTLGERDGQLAALQQQHAALGAQLKRREFEFSAARSDSAAAKTQASSYLELLRTREWRRGFDLNMFREMDALVGAADSGRDAQTAECDQLRGQLTNLEARMAAQNAAIEKFRGTAAAHATAFAQQSKDLKQAEQARTEWIAKLSLAETEKTRLIVELAARDRAVAESRAAAGAETERVAQLEADAANREEEMTVLIAHLQEARRPIQAIEADMQRLREEITAKSAAIRELTEEGEKLRAALERTKGALEEREFLIRRLERSETNNATALGRIQTSMERLGSAVAPSPVAALVPEWCPELVRIDGDRSIYHALGRRTRIGRAPGCELHIDSTSVSRHHALILAGGREAIIEDLNSTNGVLVNGRHVTRQVLSDGDLVTIGEIQFRYVEKPARRPAQPQPAEPSAEQPELAATRPPAAESTAAESPRAQGPPPG